MSQWNISGFVSATSSTLVVSQNVSSDFSSSPICMYSGNRHRVECRRMKGECFQCGSMDHILRDCPQPYSVAHTSSQSHIRSQASVQTPARHRNVRNDSRVNTGICSIDLFILTHFYVMLDCCFTKSCEHRSVKSVYFVTFSVMSYKGSTYQ